MVHGAPIQINKTNTSTDNDGIVFAILIVCLLAAYFIVIAVRFCMGSTENTFKENLFDCCGNESSQENKCEGECEGEGDPDIFKDKVLTLKSLFVIAYLVLYGVIVEVIALAAVYYGSSKFQERLVIGVRFVIVLALSWLCLVIVWILIKFVL